MEKAMSVEDKIRRAEEIYQRRKQGEPRSVTKVSVNNKKDIKLVKKMLIQMLICVAIYLIIYVIQDNHYFFSESFINKVNEILSYDTNFTELYDVVKNQVMSLINNDKEDIKNDENVENNYGSEEKEEDEKKDEQDTEQETEEVKENGIGGAEEQISLTQGEKDVENVKGTTSFIKPVNGVISSKYGQRETATGKVPKNHTGVDIAANLGTKIISATEGEVVISSDKGDFRKAFKNTNRESKCYLCPL